MFSVVHTKYINELWLYRQISLEKSTEKWWDRLLENEAKINLGELEIEKRFDELDDEARMKILQMQHETMNSALGRPRDPKKEVRTRHSYSIWVVAKQERPEIKNSKILNHNNSCLTVSSRLPRPR